jgi:hypothetical protein
VIDLENYVQENSQLNVSQIGLDSSLYIFDSRATDLEKRDRLLTEQEYMSQSNPSFGYPLSENFVIRHILRYDDYILRSSKSTYSRGRYNLNVLTSQSGDVKIIRFVDANQEQNQIVLTDD